MRTFFLEWGDKVNLTVELGLVHGYGLDISATIYSGEVLIGHLVESEYGYERDNSPTYEETNDVNSYILNIAMEPTVGKYSRSNYEKAQGSTADNNLDKFFLRLAFEF